jgi:hypothetical protein
MTMTEVKSTLTDVSNILALVAARVVEPEAAALRGAQALLAKALDWIEHPERAATEFPRPMSPSRFVVRNDGRKAEPGDQQAVA